MYGCDSPKAIRDVFSKSNMNGRLHLVQKVSVGAAGVEATVNSLAMSRRRLGGRETGQDVVM